MMVMMIATTPSLKASRRPVPIGSGSGKAGVQLEPESAGAVEPAVFEASPRRPCPAAGETLAAA
jgi:hypothetical protein